MIKALDATHFDQLVVKNGLVNLDGTLELNSLPESSFASGTQLIVIDNSSGTLITGTFAAFQYTLPNHLKAHLEYTSHQVIIHITQKCST